MELCILMPSPAESVQLEFGEWTRTHVEKEVANVWRGTVVLNTIRLSQSLGCNLISALNGYFDRLVMKGRVQSMASVCKRS